MFLPLLGHAWDPSCNQVCLKARQQLNRCRPTFIHIYPGKSTFGSRPTRFRSSFSLQSERRANLRPLSQIVPLEPLPRPSRTLNSVPARPRLCCLLCRIELWGRSPPPVISNSQFVESGSPIRGETFDCLHPYTAHAQVAAPTFTCIIGGKCRFWL